MENEIIGKRIRNLLIENNITQKDLAERIGLTQATLSRNINGVHEPRADVIKQIADYFKVSVDYILGNTTERKPQNEQITDINLAFYNQHGIVSEAQKKEIESFIEFIKSKNEAK